MAVGVVEDGKPDGVVVVVVTPADDELNEGVEPLGKTNTTVNSLTLLGSLGLSIGT